MSRNSKHNRAARKRREEQRSRSRTSERRSSQTEFADDGLELITAGLEFAQGPSANVDSLRHIVARLVRLEHSAQANELVAHAERLLDRFVDFVFDAGWQPAELAHATRRVCGVRPSRLAVVAIASQSARMSAHEQSPARWREQLADLGIGRGFTASGYVAGWRVDEALDAADGWTAILNLLGFLRYLPRMQVLLPPPTQWSATPRYVAPTSGGDLRILTKIRSLLAKAESTTYAEEAEALSAKAQDMMTRYAIDRAMVEDRTDAVLNDRVQTRRLLIDQPYADAKAMLLHHVAETNNARMILHPSFGLASVVAMPVDLDLCELLFTSLLVQSSHAMAETGRRAQSNRSPSFRRAFLLGFAERIGERLATARDDAERAASSQYGKELVPVMSAREEAVDAVFAEQFPDTVQKRQTVSNVHGHRAGRVAAELADLTGGRERLSG